MTKPIKEYPKTIDHQFLSLASLYAKQNSGCLKVQVGSVITTADHKIISMGANRADRNLCVWNNSCYREEKHGTRSKIHRNPDDCRAIHSEIDAICSAQNNLKGCIIYITRYPCEACARAIARAGIKTVVFGRDTYISEMTSDILSHDDVEIVHVNDYKEEDDNS